MMDEKIKNTLMNITARLSGLVYACSLDRESPYFNQIVREIHNDIRILNQSIREEVVTDDQDDEYDIDTRGRECCSDMLDMELRNLSETR